MTPISVATSYLPVASVAGTNITDSMYLRVRNKPAITTDTTEATELPPVRGGEER